MADAVRRWAAGQRVEDLCRACKEPREHTVVAADAEGRILRVICGYCGSQHNFRGGIKEVVVHGERPRTIVARGAAAAGAPLPLVSDRELVATRGATTDNEHLDEEEIDPMELEKLLRRIIREEAGLTPVTPAEKWRGGELVFKPGKPGLQEKTIPIDTFFHKVVMLRNRLRVLEQQVNAGDMPEDQKLKLQGYITGCYGTLTSFNILFADEDDKFKGQGGD
jgi:hypothetical protein